MCVASANRRLMPSVRAICVERIRASSPLACCSAARNARSLASGSEKSQSWLRSTVTTRIRIARNAHEVIGNARRLFAERSSRSRRESGGHEVAGA
jgi:hypothetical protein